MPADNKGLASGGLTFKREISCGLSRPAAKPHTVVNQLINSIMATINQFEDLEVWQSMLDLS